MESVFLAQDYQQIDCIARSQNRQNESLMGLLSKMFKFKGKAIASSQHNSNVTISRLFFLVMALLQFFAYQDSHKETPTLEFGHHVHLQCGVLLVFGLLLRGLWLKCFLWGLGLILALVQMHFDFRAMPDNYYIATIVKFVYLRAILDLLYRKLVFRMNLDLLAPQYHKYNTQPQRFIVERMLRVDRYQTVPRDYLENFFYELSSLYKEVPYHNLTHAFDVTTSMHNFLINLGLKSKVCKDDTQYICCLIAAYAHDAGHMGFTNGFYIQTDDELACQYSYDSPLQRMHCGLLMDLLRKYEGIVPSRQYKKHIIRMILATDNMVSDRQHQKMIERREFLRAGQIKDQEDRILLKQALLHAADVMNPAKDLEVFNRWSIQLFRQFDRQKQTLRSMGLAEAAHKPRSPKELAKGQVTFIDKLVLPLYQQLFLISNRFQVILNQLQTNRAYWQKKAIQKEPSLLKEVLK